MSTIFFTADLHLGHRRIICPDHHNRPFKSVEDMNEALITNWNQRVKAGDIVYHLGDFSFSRKADIVNQLERLNGRKFFVRGNHDKEFAKALKSIAGTSQARGIDGFEWYHELKINKQRIVLFHFPILAWHKAYGRSWHLHGHSHGKLPVNPHALRMDVGVDAVASLFSNNGTAPRPFTYNFKPISLDEVAQVMASRDFRVLDGQL